MDLIVTGLDLLKVESRALRRGVSSLWLELVLISVAGALLLLAFGLLVWGAYLAARSSLGPAPAAFLTGGLALVLAGGLLWIVRNSRS